MLSGMFGSGMFGSGQPCPCSAFASVLRGLPRRGRTNAKQTRTQSEKKLYRPARSGLVRPRSLQHQQAQPAIKVRAHA